MSASFGLNFFTESSMDTDSTSRPVPGPESEPKSGPTLEGEKELFELLGELIELDEQAVKARLAELDPELADRVREALKGEGDEAFLRTGELSPPGPMAAGRLETGREIGPYRIVELIGEGGMGQVYLAEQEQPVRRRVAIKLLLLPLAQYGALERFKAERRAMERLNHPHVGKILDAGEADGMPYLVMELIDGESITSYCDRHRLGIDDRLRLMADVCRGVEHAHRRFLLHRDIKPSNVLVMEVDGRPVPKLIDFGIAKVLDPSSVGGLTGPMAIGTPSYMSPEALSQSAELDTRSDVFSLGILLYQLLTGHLPWGSKIPLAALIERRAKHEPPKPSSFFTGRVDDEARMAAENRGVSSKGLATRLRGDLDWIVLKAIAQASEERYGSAAELAADLERVLHHEAVEARPQTLTYVLRKAVRRHRGPMIAGTLVLASLVLGIVGTSVGLVRAKQSESRALASERQAEEDADRARKARAEADQVVELLIQSLAAAGPGHVGTDRAPSEMTALELLENTALRMEDDLRDQPEIRAALATVIGDFYRQVGEYESAERHLLSALSAFEGVKDPDPLAVARANRALGELHLFDSRFEESRDYLEATLRALKGHTEPAVQLIRGAAIGNLARVEGHLGHYEVAEKLFKESINIHLEDEGPNSRTAAISMMNLGVQYFRQKQWTKAEDIYRRVLSIFEDHYPEGHQRVLNATNSLAAVVASQGNLEEAAPIFKRVLEQQKVLLGESHPQLGNTLNNLGVMHLDLGQPEASVDFHQQALELRRSALGEEHPRTAWSLDNLARAMEELGRTEEAQEMQEQALRIRKKKYGEKHLMVSRSWAHLSDLAAGRGDLDEALDLRQRALATTLELLEPESSQNGRSWVRLGVIQWRLGRRDEARESFAEGLRILEAGGEASADSLADAKRRMAEVGVE